jgi:hypothetical protein
VKIGGLLSLASDSILGGGLFGGSEGVLISSGVKELRDLDTELD